MCIYFLICIYIGPVTNGFKLMVQNINLVNWTKPTKGVNWPKPISSERFYGLIYARFQILKESFCNPKSYKKQILHLEKRIFVDMDLEKLKP